MPFQPTTICIGDVEVAVEAVGVPGSQQTSKIGRAGDQVVDTFERLRETVVAVATASVKSIQSAASAARPDEVEVEFGLKFTVSGGVIVAGGSAEANLVLRLRWTHEPAPGPAVGQVESGSPEQLAMEQV